MSFSVFFLLYPAVLTVKNISLENIHLLIYCMFGIVYKYIYLSRWTFIHFVNNLSKNDMFSTFEGTYLYVYYKCATYE